MFPTLHGELGIIAPDLVAPVVPSFAAVVRLPRDFQKRVVLDTMRNVEICPTFIHWQDLQPRHFVHGGGDGLLGRVHHHGVGHLDALVEDGVEVAVVRPLEGLRVEAFPRGPDEEGAELEKGLVDPRERLLAASVIQMGCAENVYGLTTLPDKKPCQRLRELRF